MGEPKPVRVDVASWTSVAWAGVLGLVFERLSVITDAIVLLVGDPRSVMMEVALWDVWRSPGL